MRVLGVGPQNRGGRRGLAHLKASVIDRLTEWNWSRLRRLVVRVWSAPVDSIQRSSGSRAMGCRPASRCGMVARTMAEPTFDARSRDTSATLKSADHGGSTEPTT